MIEQMSRLQARLEQRANPETRAWWERYLKQALPFRGVKMADIRTTVHTWAADEKLRDGIADRRALELALALLREPAAEDKVAGILLLAEILLPAGALQGPRDLPQLAALFEAGAIADWNTCDWLCVKVLGPLVQREGASTAQLVAAWRTAGTLWQRRAAGVAFVNLAPRGEANFAGFTELLLTVCAATVQSRERFAQTGTGWVLRELSRAEPAPVVAFIEQRLAAFSAEGLRYATERLPSPTREQLRAAHRQQRRPGRDRRLPSSDTSAL